MNNENILAVNVTNGLSILVMGGVLALLLAWGRAWASKRPQSASNAPMANFLS